MKYIAKPNTWFDAGTEVELLSGPFEGEWGLFRGIKDGKPDEETCPFYEFIINE